MEGTSIYRDNYVGIREIIQNAIDASLLQLWNDLLQNKYSSYGLSKDDVADGLDLLQFKGAGKASIFGNYDITVEVIKDELQNKVFIVVKDKGIGISKEEIKYISDIGSSREKIAESEYDYFNIYLETKMTPSNKKEVYLRKSCFCPRTDGSEAADNGYFNRFLDNEKDGYYFTNERAMFWDKDTFRLYTLTIKPCAILTENGKDRISNVESIYDGGNMTSQLHAGFLELDVMILDDKPKNYMNIDRDRLKDGAIDEDELLKVRRNMLERWCEDYWCADGEERDGYFDSMRESLCSFMLMFYRNLPGKLFKKLNDNRLWQSDILLLEQWDAR